MTEQNNNNDPASANHRRRRNRLAATITVIATTAVIVCLLRNTHGIAKQLAAIDAARAVPDSENAALIYYQILKDHPFTAAEIQCLQNAYWSSFTAGLPQWSTWPGNRDATVKLLRRACEMEKCRLSLDLDPDTILQNESLRKTMRQWTFLLASLANSDVARGHIEAAFEKHILMIKMANHMYQQSTNADFRAASLPESVALRGLAGFIVQGAAAQANLTTIDNIIVQRFTVRSDPTQAQLTTIDNVISQMQPDWEQDWPRICRVEELRKEYYKKQTNTLRRILNKLRITRPIRPPRSIHGSYLGLPKAHTGMLALRRGTRILIALRRHKNKVGRWPESLDQIQPQVPAEMFNDPFGSALVYKLAGDSFNLYSKGPNKIDEKGKRHNDCDDYPIWIP